MKKIFMVLMVGLLLMNLFTGCAKKNEDSPKDGTVATDTDTDADTADTSADTTAETLTFPLEEKVKLTALVCTRVGVDNFDENAMTKDIEKQTNIDMEFVVVPEDEAEEKLNLMLSTGDYPDIILLPQLNTSLQSLYGSQGILLPLNDMIEKSGTISKELFNQYPVAKEIFTMKDGNIYNLPQLNECFHCQSTQKMWIYKPWLDKLGLEIPTTTEEFYTVMKAFKENDPNGNGLADEIPLAGTNLGWDSEVESFLMNSFVYSANQSDAFRLFVDNGKVTASYMTEGWKDGLIYLQDLAKEGLIAEESFTQDADGLKRMGENPDVVILGAFPGGFAGMGVDIAGDRANYIALAPLKGPKGVQFAKYDPASAFVNGFSITDKCQNPEVAFMLAELLYSKDMTMKNWSGIEGTDWQYITTPDDTKLGVDGKPATWELLGTYESAVNASWNQQGNAFNTAELRAGQYVKDPNDLEAVLFQATRDKYQPYFPSTDMLLPKLQMTEQQAADIMTLKSSIQDFVTENIAISITTDVDINAEWDGYIAQLQQMGAEKLLSVYQEAYDER